MRHLIALTLPLVVGCACTAQPCTTVQSPEQQSTPIGATSARKTTDSRLLRLSIADATPENGQPALRWTIRNVSDQVLWVNVRFLVLNEQSIAADAWLELVNASGERIPPNDCRAKAGRPQPWEYVLLTPDSEISVVRSITCVTLPVGTIRVRGHFKDKNTITRGFPEDALWFIGELVSDPIEIEVTQPTHV